MRSKFCSKVKRKVCNPVQYRSHRTCVGHTFATEMGQLFSVTSCMHTHASPHHRPHNQSFPRARILHISRACRNFIVAEVTQPHVGKKAFEYLIASYSLPQRLATQANALSRCVWHHVLLKVAMESIRIPVAITEDAERLWIQPPSSFSEHDLHLGRLMCGKVYRSI